MPVRRPRGFTLIETMFVVAIVGVLAALAGVALTRDRPRVSLQTLSHELVALLRNARLNALATGRPTIVMIFPEYENPLGGTGRIVVLEDPAGTFFRTGAAPSFQTYEPASLVAGAADEIVASLDLPRDVQVARPAVMPPALAAPYGRISIDTACGFCGSGAGGRGAIRFDARGRATFHAAVGAPLDLWGASFSLATLDGEAVTPGGRTFVVTGTTGGVRSFITGG